MTAVQMLHSNQIWPPRLFNSTFTMQVRPAISGSNGNSAAARSTISASIASMQPGISSARSRWKWTPSLPAERTAALRKWMK